MWLLKLLKLLVGVGFWYFCKKKSKYANHDSNKNLDNGGILACIPEPACCCTYNNRKYILDNNAGVNKKHVTYVIINGCYQNKRKHKCINSACSCSKYETCVVYGKAYGKKMVYCLCLMILFPEYALCDNRSKTYDRKDYGIYPWPFTVACLKKAQNTDNNNFTKMGIHCKPVVALKLGWKLEFFRHLYTSDTFLQNLLLL